MYLANRKLFFKIALLHLSLIFQVCCINYLTMLKMKLHADAISVSYRMVSVSALEYFCSGDTPLDKNRGLSSRLKCINRIIT